MNRSVLICVLLVFTNTLEALALTILDKPHFMASGTAFLMVIAAWLSFESKENSEDKK